MGCRCIMQETDRNLYAGFFVRLAAFLADMLLISVFLLMIRIPYWIFILLTDWNPLGTRVLFELTCWDILKYVIVASYFVTFAYTAGATLGKMIFHLRIVSSDGEKLSFLTVLYRETIGRYLSSAILLMGYFLIAADTEKKGLHDTLCDTRVIYYFKEKERNLEETYLTENSMKNDLQDIPEYENSVYEEEMEPPLNVEYTANEALSQNEKMEENDYWTH